VGFFFTFLTMGCVAAAIKPAKPAQEKLRLIGVIRGLAGQTA